MNDFFRNFLNFLNFYYYPKRNLVMVHKMTLSPNWNFKFLSLKRPKLEEGVKSNKKLLEYEMSIGLNNLRIKSLMEIIISLLYLFRFGGNGDYKMVLICSSPRPQVYYCT